MSVLVTGGAGYIGSVTVTLLRAQGEDVVVLDQLSGGHRAAVAPEVPFYVGNVSDQALVRRVCREHAVESCIHFAASIAVGESVAQPAAYFANNTAGGILLVQALIAAGVRRFVFSSTAATFGEPQYMPIDEAHPQQPTNPYGWSKLMMERVLAACDPAHGLKFVALRYFNACGAVPERGEDHRPETHLIPLVLFAALGRRPAITVFGDDYPTSDGTAVRDYVHVADLGQAHLRALAHLRGGGDSLFLNLGNGQGYTVRQVIETARTVTGLPIKVNEAPRRAGDSSHLVANAARARQVLGWEPRYPALTDIIRSAWDWHRQHPDGYPD